LFFKSQSTTNAQNYLHLNRDTRFDRGLSHLVKDPGAVVNGFSLIMCPFLFILELNILGLLNVPTDKNLKDTGPSVVRLYLEN